MTRLTGPRHQLTRGGTRNPDGHAPNPLFPKIAVISAVTVSLLLANFTPSVSPTFGAETAGPIDIGTVSQFSVLGHTTVTNTGPSTMTDGLGVSPLGSIVGFPPGQVSGETHTADATAATAQTHAAAAYNDAAGRTFTTAISGDQAGKTLGPGVYFSDAALTVSTTLVLDGQGDPSSVFIFQVNAAMSVAASGTIRLSNGAQPDNVFWQVSGALSLGATSTFIGTVVAQGAVTVGAGGVVAGRVVSLAGAVTLASNTIITIMPVPLKTASSYSVLATGAVTSSGPTMLSGDLGVSPWFEVSGFPDGIVSGKTEQGTAAAEQALTDARAADRDISQRFATAELPAELAGLTLRSGVHHTSDSAVLNGTMLLDAQNNPNAVFIIRIEGTLTTGSASSARLLNGAQASRVFWQVQGNTVLGAASSFSGTLLSTGRISVGVQTALNGRLLALAGGVILKGTTATDTVPVPLGTASTYSALAATTITNTGPTVLSGDLGVFPGRSVEGFPEGKYGGTLHAGDEDAGLAQKDARLAYTDAQTRAPTGTLAGDIGNQTLEPGVYSAAAALTLTGTLTLDAGNNPGAVFIFQIGAAFTTGASSSISLVNEAQADRVFWQVLGAAVLGADSEFIGTVLADGAITVGANAQLNGRALSVTGAVTTGANPVTNPEPFRGALTATSSGVTLAGIVLNGANMQQSGSAPEPWSVTDARGSGEPWALTVTATAPTSAAGTVDAIVRKLPVGNLILDPGTVLAGSTADPVTGISAGPLTMSVEPQALIRATGPNRGTYLFTPRFTLDIPANAFRSNFSAVPHTSELIPYVASITITIG